MIKAIFQALKLTTIFLLASIFVIKVPDVHRRLLRNYVGNKVVSITNDKGNSGGTGFFLKTPSGKSYLLTNKHICQLKDANGIVYVHTEDGSTIPSKVIEEAKDTDLCIIENVKGYKGLSVGGKNYSGQWIYAIGHPKLYPLVMVGGEIFANSNIDVFDHLIDPKNPQCDGKVQDVQFLFFTLKACMHTVNANFTDLTILPGNSGSPVVDAWGRVEGVVFAGDSDANWGFTIPVQDLIKFISKY